MSIRKATIKTIVEKAIIQIDKNRCAAAKVTLEALDARMSGTVQKRAPGKYALFVKANYGKMQKQHPGLKAPALMKKIAAEWNLKK
jgi:hypothetical protein